MWCVECGETLTAEEEQRLGRDIDFVEHGSPPHAIRIGNTAEYWRQVAFMYRKRAEEAEVNLEQLQRRLVEHTG